MLFMQFVDSVPCSYDHATGTYMSQMSPVQTLPKFFCNIHFNILHPSRLRYSKWNVWY